MTQIERQKAAADFAAVWADKGDEKQHTQSFWTSLLREVYGVSAPEKTIDFEKRVKIGGTKFIDAYLADTRVAIEQKGAKIDLDKSEKQSDGTELTPFEQAKRYNDNLPFSEKCRWIVVCNFTEFRIHDMEKSEPEKHFETVLLKDLPHDYYRLQFLVDQKNENIRSEEEISIQAGKLVGKLYDAISPEYKNPDEKSFRSLNILCVRIVFCLYAEDAGLFETRTSFEDYIKSFAVENLRDGIIKLFKALDTKLSDRDKYDVKLQPFPYVNGGLFKDETIEIPNFTQEIVDVIVNDCAPFNWSEISPTIFGAVFESTLNPETRRKGGMHYTSIQNIHKVIDPLFMDDLNAEFEEIVGSNAWSLSEAEVLTNRSLSEVEGNKRNKKKKSLSPKERTAALHDFQKKLGSLTFLDPACGSGNFLTETYLSLRRLENKVISILNKGERAFGFDEFIKVHINQFYGIEINDFAVTVAKTALWIAESQMILETEAILSQNIDFLPLTNHANIIEGNALRLDWATLSEEERVGFLFAEKLNIYDEADFSEDSLEVRSAETDATSLYGRKFKELNVIQREGERKKPPKKETKWVVYDYIIGNPPFVGYSLQSDRQKEDTLQNFVQENGKQYKAAGKIDYVANWYFKAAKLIQNTKTRCAFVSTNSITQGEQVAAVWKPIFERFKIHIDFAYQTFKWENETADKKNMAAVHCVIIGFSNAENEKPRIIFGSDSQSMVAKNINAYLIDGADVFVESRPVPLCDVPQMSSGGKPVEGGHLIFTEEEKSDFLKKEPKAAQYFRPFMGSDDFINGHTRWCLWLLGAAPNELRAMPNVMKRIEEVRKFRLASVKAATREYANYPAQFMEIKQPESDYLMIPATSSENRQYVPIGYLDKNVVASNAASFVPNATLYHFGILASSVHNVWMRVVCGRLKSDYRYSINIVYNNFPWCNPSAEQKAKIEQTAQGVLDARAKYPDSSLADLYDESAMPPELRKAHRENDKAVMQAYGFKQGMEESEIVAELFKLYEVLTQKA